VNTSSHLFSFQLLNILMRENWKDSSLYLRSPLLR
jgi:hypothetical protein